MHFSKSRWQFGGSSSKRETTCSHNLSCSNDSSISSHDLDDLGLLPGLNKRADRVGLGSYIKGICSDWEKIAPDSEGIESDCERGYLEWYSDFK